MSQCGGVGVDQVGVSTFNVNDHLMKHFFCGRISQICTLLLKGLLTSDTVQTFPQDIWCL